MKHTQKLGLKVINEFEFNENNIRELIHSPFRIVYLKEEKIIHIIRGWRSERLLNLKDTPAKK